MDVQGEPFVVNGSAGGAAMISVFTMVGQILETCPNNSSFAPEIFSSCVHRPEITGCQQTKWIFIRVTNLL